MKKYFILCVLVILVFGVACKKSYTPIYDFSGNNWDFQQPINFNLKITDTTSTYSIFLFFRNTIEYPYQNIYFLIQTQYENEIIQRDTVEYAITNKYGNWLGSGIGKTKDNYFIVKEQQEFQKDGVYTVSIQHGMRKNPLRGANKIGLKLTKND
tara:strand:+ start:354 stop:815 length:462 start_codon:yes stop_codon:yes gene_type:complete